MDSRLEAIIRGMIRTERSRRTTPAYEALARVTHEFTASGGLGHGRYAVVLDREVAGEYEVRAEKWMSITRQAVSEAELTWTSERVRDINNLLSTELLVDWEELIGLLRQKVSHGMQARIDEIEKAKNRIDAQFSHELELLLYAQDRTKIPIEELLVAPRYAPVLFALKKARILLDSIEPDYANAGKEAVAAVEQLARITVGKPTVTLGEAIKDLRNSSRIQAPLLKGIEEIWIWASSTPGVRHGSGAPADVDVATARYVVAQAEAAIGLLLAHDAMSV